MWGGAKSLASSALNGLSSLAGMAFSALKMGAAGAAIGIAALGAALFKTADALRGVIGAGRFADNGPLSATQLKESRDGLRAVDSMMITLRAAWERLSVAVSPVLKIVSNFVQHLVEKLQPAIPRIASAFQGFAEVGIAVFGLLVDGITQAVNWVWKLVDGWLGLSKGASSAREIVINVLKNIAVGASYVWDTFKAGIGVVLVLLGKFVSGISYVTDAFAGLVSFAKLLPDEIKPSWVDGFADGVQRASDLVTATGRKLDKWGKDAINGFGNGKKAVGEFFDGIAQGNHLPEVKLKIAPVNYTAVGAMLKGSKEAFSIETKFRMQDFLRPKEDIPKQQLQVEKQQVQELKQLNKAFDKWSPLGLEAW